MQVPQFISLVRQGFVTAPEEISLLKSFIDEYPYCQSARILYSGALSQIQDLQADKTIRLTALYAGDRKKYRQHILSHTEENSTSRAAGTSTSVFEEETMSASGSSLFSDSEETAFFPAADRSENILAEQPVAQEERFSAEATPFLTNEKQSAAKDEKNEQDPVASPSSREEKLPDDPHEIIRRRLNEILAAKPADAQSIPASVETELPPVVESVLPEQVMEDPVKKTPVEVALRTEVEAAASASAENATDHGTDAEEIILRKEVMLIKDDVDKEELAHIAEETVLHSLEKLPPPAKDTEPLTFTGWLRLKNQGAFGNIEEVHSGDLPAITSFSPQPMISQAPGEDFAGIAAAKDADEGESPDKLIERFIAAAPRITPSKTEFYSPAIQAKKSVEEDDSMVTETLANIYREQGLLVKARAAYEKLSLLFPEKSSSFAALIQEIDKSLNTEE